MTEEPRTLNSVCHLIEDCLHATAPVVEDGYPLIRTPNIGKGRFDLSGVFRVSEETYGKWTRRAVPQDGDIILAREAPAGNAAIVKGGEKVCLGQRTVLIRPDPEKVDPDFLCYFLLAPKQQGFLLSGATGATAQHVNMKDIRRLPLYGLPELDSQKRVGDFLSGYDELMSNNRRRIELLEEAARILYAEWFVRLRFPGRESTRIADGLPRGWERKTVGEVAEVNRATLSNAFDGEIHYVDIASVVPGQINETTTYGFREAPSRARRVVRHGDTIWSCVRPNRRSHAVIWNPPDNLIVSTGFAVLTPTEAPSTFIYFATTTDDFVGYLENHARGAAYPAVVASDFKRAKILVPPKKLLGSFDEIAQPIFSQIHNLRQQNQKLRAARDLLLPRLISGEIAV